MINTITITFTTNNNNLQHAPPASKKNKIIIIVSTVSSLSDTASSHNIIIHHAPPRIFKTVSGAASVQYYKVLLQYYFVLQSTTPYYKVLLQYYSVLQSTTPVLLRTTNYYSSTTSYYKVLLQYYSVLQSTSPVLQSTTPSSEPATKSDTWASPNIAPVKQNDSHVWSWSHMKPHLQCAEQQVSPSNLTKYCACHTEWLACLIVVTYETSFPMRGATGVTIQPHQILRLPRKMTLQDFKENRQKQVKRHFQCGADPSMIRAWSDHDPTMIRPWSEHDPRMKTQSATRLACEVTFRGPQKHFLL